MQDLQLLNRFKVLETLNTNNVSDENNIDFNTDMKSNVTSCKIPESAHVRSKAKNMANKEFKYNKKYN